MKFAVLDEAVPSDIAAILSEEDREVDPFPDAWRSLSDDELIDRASAAAYRWLITCDKNMPFQQHLRSRTISVLVLPDQRLPRIGLLKENIRVVLRQPFPGCFVVLDDKCHIDGKPVVHMSGRKGRGE